MAKTKPVQARLSDLAPGQLGDFFALLAEKNKGATREGKAYYSCRFRDARRTVAFMVWGDGPWFAACESDWQTGHFYKLRASWAEHERYGPQIFELLAIRPTTDADLADGFDPAQLVESSRYDPETMFLELKALATSQIADEPLRKLVLTLLDRHAGPLKRLPATRDRFHPFAGGLLEHTLSVTRSAVQLAERYAAYYTELKPPLNRDLVAAGAILHDIGRVLEFGDEATAPSVTIPGRLAGHLLLGRDLVRDKARELGDVNPELLQLLEHVLLSYLALPEWGSPRLPLVPESLIIHHAVDLDAKLEMYVRCLSRDQAAGPFTDREPGLNRQLFK
ncbi:MAG TPA: HD domain-containing protein, partial [Gemmataceae bacterium]|nr:HD domain-containing protein [Gemmataceae bacterium]